MTLTTKAIEAAKYSGSGDRLGDGNGLYLRLHRGGNKTFELRAAVGGKRAWIVLGAYPETGLKSARGLAAMTRTRIDDGMDLQSIRAALASPGACEEVDAPDIAEPERKAANDAVTNAPSAGPSFREMSRTWFEQKKKGLRNGKHIAQNWTTLTAYVFPTLGNRPVAEIEVDEIIEAIRPIWHDKHETAKRTLGRVKEVFALAKIRRIRPDNPADFDVRIAFGPVRRRRKHHGSLAFERMPEFWEWLKTVRCQEETRQATMLLVLTAKRTGEMRHSKWDFFDEASGVWTTPEGLMKMGREHRVPLSRQAAAILGNMALLTAGAPHVFAKPDNKTGLLSENTVRNLVRLFDPGITGHGFRATFRTWARRQKKYAEDVMEFALAHQPEDLEAAYQRDDLLDERRELMQDWADFVTGGMNPARLIEE